MVGIKEVVTLTSDLSRKNLEKDFERMDTPQGTFYRRHFLVLPYKTNLTRKSRRLLRYSPRPRRLRI